MRYLTVLGMVVLLAGIGLRVSGSGNPAGASRTLLIAPGERVGPFVVGGTLSDLRGRLDSPDLLAFETRLSSTQGLKTYKYDPLRLHVRVSAQGETVEEMETTNPDFRTVGGSGVGSTVAQITKEHGLDYTKVGPHMIYFGKGIAFTLVQAKVSAVAIFPVGTPADQQYRRGVAEIQNANPRQAEQAFLASLTLDERNVKALVGLGIAYVSQDKPYLGVRAFERAIALDPKYAPAYQSLGVLHMKYGKPDEAIKAYGKAVEAAPHDPEVRTGLANVYMELAHYDLAVAEFRKTLEEHPAYTPALTGLAVAFELRGEKKMAAETYRRLLAVVPKEEQERRFELEMRIKVLEQ